MKKLYASTVMKNEHTTGTIKYYQILEEKYGIEIVKQMKNYEPESTRIENITDSKEKINKVLEFCESVGLPITLSDIGISEIKEEEIMNVAKLSCDVNETIHNMPFEVDCEQVYAAILAADSLGKNFKIKKMNLDSKLQVPFIRTQDHYQY